MIDNSAEFLKKLEGRLKEISTPINSLPLRRTISHGLNARRRFAPTIRGQDIRSPVSSSGDFSGVVNLGQDLPSLAELVRREEQEKILEKAKKQKHPGSIPLPKKWDGRPDDLPGR